jgi:hypothetical protein
MAQTRFDIRSEVIRPLFASVGATDVAVEAVRGSVNDLQKRFAEVQKDVQARVAGVSRSVQELDLEPKVRVNELQEWLRAFLKDGEITYDDLVARGETLVERIRRQQSTKDAVRSAETAAAKAKTTRTQAAQATRSTVSAAEEQAKSTAKTAERAARTTARTARKRSTAPQSSAKATATTAKRAAKSARTAAAEGAKKVGD